MEAKRDAGRVFKAASEGSPLDLAKRLRLVKFAGGLGISGTYVIGGRERAEACLLLRLQGWEGMTSA